MAVPALPWRRQRGDHEREAGTRGRHRERADSPSTVGYPSSLAVLHRAFRPSHGSQLPAGALDALAESLGRLTVRDLLVVPAVTSRTGNDAATRTQVLAVGRRGIGLWADGNGAPDALVTVSYGELAAIEERRDALSTVLEVHTRTRCLSLRYHTVGQTRVDDLMAAARRRAAGDGLPVPTVSIDLDRYPPLWRGVLASTPLAPAEAGVPSAVAVGRFRAPRGGLREFLIALTAYELIIARPPADLRNEGGYPTERLYVPRRRLREIRITGQHLLIDTAGVLFDVAIASSMMPTAREVLEPLLPAMTASGG